MPPSENQAHVLLRRRRGKVMKWGGGCIKLFYGHEWKERERGLCSECVFLTSMGRDFKGLLKGGQQDFFFT